jgi:hypothetical protein
MQTLDIKINKEKLKDLAKKSILFSVSPEDLNDFLKLIDSVEENTDGEEKINFLLKKFQEERNTVIESFKKITENN